MREIKKILNSILNWFIFSWTLFQWVFKERPPEFVLMVIKKYIALESPYYPSTMYWGRTVQKSAELLGALTDSYLETKSEVTLDQILEVLKKEFIERDKNGRK